VDQRMQASPARKINAGNVKWQPSTNLLMGPHNGVEVSNEHPRTRLSMNQSGEIRPERSSVNVKCGGIYSSYVYGLAFIHQSESNTLSSVKKNREC